MEDQPTGNKPIDGYPRGNCPLDDCPIRDCSVVIILWETTLWEVGDLLAMAQSGGLGRACMSGARTYESTKLEPMCTILESLVVDSDGMTTLMGKMEYDTVVLSESGLGRQTRPLGKLPCTRPPYPRA